MFGVTVVISLFLVGGLRFGKPCGGDGFLGPDGRNRYPHDHIGVCGRRERTLFGKVVWSAMNDSCTVEKKKYVVGSSAGKKVSGADKAASKKSTSVSRGSMRSRATAGRKSRAPASEGWRQEQL